MPYLSVVSPVYKAEKFISQLVSEITEVVQKITDDYEIVLVEDGSHDRSWELIEGICKLDPHVKGIKLSRNFGQHYAITAGLDHCKGEWVVVMDCDLQDRPEEIPNLLNKAKEGHKIVLARRQVRKDSFRKKLSSRIFYRLLTFLTGVKQDATVANFGIYHKDVIAAVSKMREPFRNFAAIVKWVGFSPTTINVSHSKRAEGRTSYNINKLIKLAIDTILAYSNKPLYYIVTLGFIISFLAFVASLIIIIRYLSGNITVLGYTSIILSVWVLGGLIIMFLGVVGLYIGKTFEGIKNRPIYIVTETRNLNRV